MKRIKKKDKKAKSVPKKAQHIHNFNKNKITAVFIALFTFLFSMFFIPDKQNQVILDINIWVFYFISLLFSIIIFLNIFLSEKPKIKEVNKLIFLFVVLFNIGVSFLQYTNVPVANNTIYLQLLALQKFLIIQTSVIGIVLIWQHKTTLNKIINKKFTGEQTEKTQIFTKFFQPIKVLFTKKEILSTSIFFVIIGLSIFTLFYKLDYFDIYSDEVQVTKAAAGYYHTGEFYQWDFIKEEISKIPLNRAKPHLFLIAQSYKLFGINTWAARFPSAFFALILIVFLFFIGRFFVKDRAAVLLTIFSFALYYDFLALGRWARMYAMVFPLFLLSFYWAYKFLTESCTKIKFLKGKFFSKYFNFNYIYLPFLLVLLFLNLKTHQNTTLIFPVYLIFSIISSFLFLKEKKYITASIIAILILINQIINPYKVDFTRFTFFEIDHVAQYSEILFGYPFSVFTNIIFLTVGFSTLFIIKNTTFKKNFLILFVLSTTTWVLFSYIFDYAYHYRYVSFATPLIVLLIIASYVLISKLYNKYIQAFLVVLLIAFVSTSFVNNYDNLYVKNSISPARPSIAHQSIVKNFKKGDVIFRHYGPKRYLAGIDKETNFIDIAKSKGTRSFFEIFEKINKYKSGWLIWHSYYSWNIDPDLISYANLYFKKYNGLGVDKTGEEVFYYNEKMIHSFEEFKLFKNMPFANLKLSNSYSLAFELTTNGLTKGNIFTIKNDSINKFIFKINNKTFIVKISQNDSIFVQLLVNKKNKLVFFQDVKDRTTSFGIFLNGKLLSNKEIKTETDLVKFQIVPSFNGNIDKIRLYDFVLSQEQINEIDKDSKGLETLEANNNKFQTLYLWKRK